MLSKNRMLKASRGHAEAVFWRRSSGDEGLPIYHDRDIGPPGQFAAERRVLVQETREVDARSAWHISQAGNKRVRRSLRQGWDRVWLVDVGHKNEVERTCQWVSPNASEYLLVNYTTDNEFMTVRGMHPLMTAFNAAQSQSYSLTFRT